LLSGSILFNLINFFLVLITSTAFFFSLEFNFLPTFFSIYSITLSSDSSSSTVIVYSGSTFFLIVFTFITELASSDFFSSFPSASTEVDIAGAVAAGATIELAGATIVLAGVTATLGTGALAGTDFATSSKGASTVTGAGVDIGGLIIVDYDVGGNANP
jgi:hypothetical protein